MRALLLVTAFVLPARAEAPPSSLRARAFAVATADVLASEAGADMLRAGGNAADAAVAAAFVLGVVNPWNSGIGGGGFAVVHLASGRSTFVDFRETAPAAARGDLFLRDGRPDPDLSRRGGLAVGVPGEVAGLAEISRRFGRLGLAKAAAPAIRIAEEGFPARPALAKSFASGPPADARLAALFFRDGAIVPTGETLRGAALAKTLRAIAARGPTAFYRGPVARAIVEASRATGGVLTERDLAGYRVRTSEPMRFAYRGRTIETAPLPSSGGFALAEALAMLEAHDLSPAGAGSAAELHLLAEALKPAFADRAAALGDTPEAARAVVAMLDPARLRARAARIDPARALPAAAWAEPVAVRDDRGTTHLSVVDSAGNAVALSTTVNLAFGAQLTAGETGVVLNDQMDDFASQPGVPNAFGLVQSAENAVGPGKRPLSSMAPTIVLQDGRPVLVAGAAGGPRIVSATLRLVTAIVDHGLGAADAMALARVHHQWLPDELVLEARAPREICRALAARGHRIVRAPGVGVAQAIVVHGPGDLEAASDPRGEGAAAPAGE